ncbi:MAG: GDYXXLXY domain-containing protein [Magnetococcales bacterium]|nr:GDYXXLXY domain-containing protein [Magnetococcales bacterium]
MKVARNLLFLVGLITILIVINVQIRQKEEIIDYGRTVLLRLQPIDPRSVMQGDFMRLRYNAQIQERSTLDKAGEAATSTNIPWNGQVVYRLLDGNIARLERIYKGGSLQPNEHLLDYKLQKSRNDLEFIFSADSFFFQEGHAKHYENARYGVLKVASNGSSVLIGLANNDGHIIKPQ